MLDERTEKQFVIAVVDDNPAILQLAASVLRMQGYRVLEARCGTEALHTAERHDEAVDLLLTDIDMPGMDGVSLSQEVRERWPETRVVFMSGGHQADDVESEAFLSKPFVPNELLAIVEDSLNSGPLLCQPGTFEVDRIAATPPSLAASPQ